MRRILLVLGMVLGTGVTPVQATTMCAADDWVVVTLDPTVNGTSHSANGTLYEWSATFDYGTVWGMATCMDVAGNINTPVADLRGTDGTLATGGERKGPSCWCKMTHPAPSAWVFLYTFASVDACRSGCVADRCGNFVRGAMDCRGSLFGSVGQ